MHLTLRDAADRAEALRRLLPVERRAVDGATVDDWQDCALLDVIEDGAAVGAIAVELIGDRAFVPAAANTGRATWAHLRLLELMVQRAGMRAIGMRTRRRGLVRQLVRLGYSAVSEGGGAWELSKELH